MRIFIPFILFFMSLFFIACDTSDDSYFSGAQDTEITLTGLVKDHSTGVLLADVNIKISSIDTDISTNVNGLYETSLISQTDYTLDFNKSDYLPIQYLIHTTSDNQQNLETVYLVPSNTGSTSGASGVITNTHTSELLEDVNVSIILGINNQTGTVVASTNTLVDGSYSFRDIDVGTYTIKMSLLDYITGYDTLYIVGGQTGADQNFSISPEVYSIDGNNSISGTIKSATTGLGLDNVNISLRMGVDTKTGSIVATTNTVSDGTYSIHNIALGDYSAEMSLDGYITGYGNINVTAGDDGNNNNFVLSPELAADEEMRLILTWGDSPTDLDSFLLITKDDNSTDTIYYGNKTVTDYGILDVDEMNGYGPETTTINYLSTGKYIYYISRYSSGDLNTSNASVQVIRPGEDILVIDINTSTNEKYWEVLHIDNGIVTIVNETNATAPVL